MTDSPGDPLAHAAAAHVTQGMIVGLGTGRAASRAIHALAHRAASEPLRLRCVATSIASHTLAQSLGLHVEPAEHIDKIDFLFDGADEVDPHLRMIKGRGGAMTREKIIARAATRRLYLVQRSKLVSRLGETAPLPIEILQFGADATRRALRALGLETVTRRSSEGADARTDDHNPILDATLTREADLAELARAIDDIPGVVGHGLFLNEADEIIIEEADLGPITRRARPSQT